MPWVSWGEHVLESTIEAFHERISGGGGDQKLHKQEIIVSTIHPYACFLKGTKITSNNAIESKLINSNHYDN